jgi:stage II sporulation protein P
VIGVSPDSGWWNIVVKPENVPSGNAWVSAEYVAAQNIENVPVVQPPPLPPGAEVPVPDPDDPKVTTIDVVNVRSGPGLEYPIYGLAPKGATGKVVGVSDDGGWWAVELPANISPDEIGWVSADWVIAENIDNVPVLPPGELPPPADISPPGPNDPQATSIEPINVRSGPGSIYESYGVVPIGTTGWVIGVSQDSSWWVVAVPAEISPDGMGWVSAAYVTTANTDGVPVIETPPLP